jgi:hypothetical protein
MSQLFAPGADAYERAVREFAPNVSGAMPIVGLNGFAHSTRPGRFFFSETAHIAALAVRSRSDARRLITQRSRN